MPPGNLFSASAGDNQLAEERLKEIKKLREELKDKQILEEENAKLKAELNQIKEKRMEMEEPLYFEIDGRTIRCYTLSSLKVESLILGSGSYGVVRKGYDEKNQCVAVKQFNYLNHMDRREVKFLSKHSHTHIVQFLGAVLNRYELPNGKMETECIGYVMEYLELGTLANVIHNPSKVYSMKSICLWIKQIGSALQYMHEREMIHRDLKPENILLAAMNHLKLADFVLIKKISDKRSFTSGVGTDFYRAPEVSSNDYDQQADIYSFGVIILELITRKRPQDSFEILQKALRNA